MNVPRKINKARAIVLKAFGSVVLLANFVSQSVFYDSWKSMESQLNVELTRAEEHQAAWIGAEKAWASESRSGREATELYGSAIALLVADYALCRSHRDVCTSTEFHDPYRPMSVLPATIEPSKIRERVAGHIETFRPLKRDLYQHALDLWTWGRTARLMTILFYVAGTLLLLSGLWFERRGVDE